MSRSNAKPTVVIGGAGFIGSNVVDRLLSQGESVIVFDSLVRPGVESNLEWLRNRHGNKLEFVLGDIRNRRSLRPIVERAAHIYNFAAQVAVTTSLLEPLEDFDSNALGTLNLLEEIRRLDDPPSLIFTSTNKVYGGLEDIDLEVRSSRYEPKMRRIRERGIGEDRRLDFHSPYGCSKGCADQYVIDYGRTYGLKTGVFRMSCIYGPHQCGTEDQGWVAHFLLSALRHEPLTIYGDGMQVRDVLYVEDLVDALFAFSASINQLAGQAFNIGGGPANAISLLELLQLIKELNGALPLLAFEDWRPGDQRYYVSDTSKFGEATGWRPKVSATEGIERLYRWLEGIGKAEKFVQAVAL